MGIFDFAKDAGEKIGIGKSTKEEAAAKAKRDKAAKEVRDANAAKKKAAAEAKKAAAAKQKAAERAKRVAEKQKKLDAAEAEREAKKAAELTKHVSKLGLKVSKLEVAFDDGVATVKGVVSNLADKEKVVLAIGNVAGVKRVKEAIRLRPGRKTAAPATKEGRAAAARKKKAAAAAQTMHTVTRGDTLSALAKKYLGDAKRYPEIFKANQPMLSDPDKIEVGQVLRIPKA